VALRDLAFSDLSEGQKQRVMLARVVASEPVLALLDEPTAAMDVRAEEETLQLIDRLRREYDMAVVIVSHFLGVAARYAEQVLLVDKEHQSVRSGPPAEVLGHVDFATASALAEARGEAST
jgi:zinc transport system ATP-binding protein